MTRLTRSLKSGGAVSLLYLLLLADLLPLPLVSPETKAALLPVLPWWLLVAFGAYCLWTLGVGILTFGECDGAYTELLQEINEAKHDLRAKGVSVD